MPRVKERTEKRIKEKSKGVVGYQVISDSNTINIAYSRVSET